MKLSPPTVLLLPYNEVIPSHSKIIFSTCWGCFLQQSFFPTVKLSPPTITLLLYNDITTQEPSYHQLTYDVGSCPLKL